MKYQGWANYQTWAVNVWYNNEQGLQDMYLDIARNGLVTDHPRTHTADALKEYTETVNPLQDDASMYSDIMNNALANVDWYEIADVFMEIVRNEGEESVEDITGDNSDNKDGALEDNRYVVRGDTRSKQITLMEQCWDDALKMATGRSLDDRAIANIAIGFFNSRQSWR